MYYHKSHRHDYYVTFVITNVFSLENNFQKMFLVMWSSSYDVGFTTETIKALGISILGHK